MSLIHYIYKADLLSLLKQTPMNERNNTYFQSDQSDGGPVVRHSVIGHSLFEDFMFQSEWHGICLVKIEILCDAFISDVHFVII